jgi:hypothetical protein
LAFFLLPCGIFFFSGGAAAWCIAAPRRIPSCMNGRN